MSFRRFRESSLYDQNIASVITSYLDEDYQLLLPVFEQYNSQVEDIKYITENHPEYDDWNEDGTLFILRGNIANVDNFLETVSNRIGNRRFGDDPEDGLSSRRNDDGSMTYELFIRQ